MKTVAIWVASLAFALIPLFVGGMLDADKFEQPQADAASKAAAAQVAYGNWSPK